MYTPKTGIFRIKTIMLKPLQGVTLYMPITQGVALGYMLKGFQPAGWYDKHAKV